LGADTSFFNKLNILNLPDKANNHRKGFNNNEKLNIFNILYDDEHEI
jgi:hypothetical protein